MAQLVTHMSQVSRRLLPQWLEALRFPRPYSTCMPFPFVISLPTTAASALVSGDTVPLGNLMNTLFRRMFILPVSVYPGGRLSPFAE
jgi:hypothetical protein